MFSFPTFGRMGCLFEGELSLAPIGIENGKSRGVLGRGTEVPRVSMRSKPLLYSNLGTIH